MKLAALLTVLLLLSACEQKNPEVAGKGNRMNCDAGGLALSGSGDQEVGVGSFGIQGDIIGGFGLGLNVERGGKVYEVSTALMPLPMQAGTYHFPGLEEPGMTLASYKIKTADRDPLRDYNGGIYNQHFSPVENDPEAKLKIQIDKFAVSDAPLPGFKRIHAIGAFDFNAAALPGAEPSEACIRDGVTRSLESISAKKRLLPMFNAKVCGAEKTHIHCSFDVVADLVKPN